jgi:putative ABC transport system permease protein
MFSIILRFTFRNLIKNRLYHLISISGLTIAMASAFYILIWVNHELSYDRFHPDIERLYRLTFEYHSKEHQSHFARSYQEWVMQIPGYFPEVEQMIRLQPMREARIRIKDNKFYNSRNFCTDSAFFNVFGFELIQGDPETVLSDPRSVVLAESIARKYFGEEDPIGQEIFSGHQFDTVMNMYTVTGIMKDFPANSHFHIDILGSMDDPKQHVGWAYIYILLHEGNDLGLMLTKFPDFLKQFMDEEQVADWTPHLQPVKDIHLYSDKDREIEQNGKAQLIYIFIVVAIVLIIIAMINYANLQLATINKKMTFIFQNRVVGARVRDIIRFVAFEAGIISLLAFFLAIVLLLIGLSGFNRFFYYQFRLDNANIWFQILILGIVVSGMGILAGTYPVILLRAKEKIFSLSGRVFYQFGFMIHPAGGGISGRKLLIVFQFLGSVILIISSILIYMQVHYMLESGIGSGEKNILVLKNLPRPVLDHYMVFKRELLSSPLIKEVSASMEEPSHEVLDAMHFEMDGMGESLKDEYLNVLPVDHTFLDFFKIRLLAGENFPDYRGMEEPESYIINESALKKLGFSSPDEVLGRPFKLLFQWPEIFKGGKIIGVSEDFYFYSMTEPIKPLVMFQKHIWYWCFLIKVDEDNFSEAVEYLVKKWDEIYPEYPMHYDFVDDLYASIYRIEITQAKVLGVFALLTIIIACLGLIGLMMYFIETKTKEIGIRKVNGASLLRIMIFLNREMTVWILTAILICVPVTWLLIKKWLQNFIYRIEIKPLVFIITSILIIIIALISVSFQSYRAASRNPAESLRYE